MRRALSAAALISGLAASIATSPPPTNIPSASATVEGIVLDPESPDLELVLSITTRGAVRPSQVRGLYLEPILENLGPEAVRLELYELLEPYEGEGVPEDALLLGTTSIRGALGEEPGLATGGIQARLSHPGEEVHLLLHLVDDGDLEGDLDLTVSGPDLDPEARARISLEVSP